MENIKYQIGSGERILFWKDRWARDRPLGAQFPDLLKCANDREAKVKSSMARIGGQVVWCPTLRRNLTDNETSQFILLLNFLQGMFILESGEDVRVQIASKDRTFSVSSFLAIPNNPRERSVASSIWKLKAPPRVIIFGWMGIKKSIITMDKGEGG